MQSEFEDMFDEKLLKKGCRISCHYERGLVSQLGKRLQSYWKIGIHWLTTVRNLLL